MLPQSNAQLISIVVGGTGTTEDWDQPTTTGSTMKWSGSSDAYVLEKVRTVFSQNEGALIKQRDIQIIIPASLLDDLGNSLQVEVGDVITYLFRGVTHQRIVMEYEAPFLPGMGIQEYIKLHLRPEPIEEALEAS